MPYTTVDSPTDTMLGQRGGNASYMVQTEHMPRKIGNGPGYGGSAHGKYEPFTPGHELATKHGTTAAIRPLRHSDSNRPSSARSLINLFSS